MHGLKPLQKTVCLFAIVIVCAFYYQRPFYHHLYVLLLICGIFNHGLEDHEKKMTNVIHAFDVTLAHFTCFYTLCDAYESILIRVTVSNIVMLYVFEHLWVAYADYLHMMIHVHLVVSMVLFLSTVPSVLTVPAVPGDFAIPVEPLVY